MGRWTRYNVMWSSLSVTYQWFSPCTMVSPDNKTNCQNITEILMKKEDKFEDTKGIVGREKWKKDGQLSKEKGNNDKQRSTKQYTEN